MTKRENPRRREKEFAKSQQRSSRFENRKEFIREPKTNIVEEINEDLVLGRNAVIELLKSDRTIEYVCVSKGDLEGSIKVILGLAKDKGVIIKEVDRRKLDAMSGGLVHQGVIAKVTPFKYCEVTEILEEAEKKEENPIIIILDE